MPSHEGQYRQVELEDHVVGLPDIPGRAIEQGHADVGDCGAHQGAQEGQHERLGKERRDDPQPGGPNGGSDRRFPGAKRGPGHEEVCHVGDGDEQNEDRRDLHSPEDRAELRAGIVFGEGAEAGGEPGIGFGIFAGQMFRDLGELELGLVHG